MGLPRGMASWVFDQKTLIAALMLLYAVSSITRGILWIENRQRFKGLQLWFVDALFMCLAFALWFFQELLPAYLSQVVAPSLAVAALIAFLLGFEDFFDVWPTQPRRTFNAVLLVLSISLFFYLYQAQLGERYTSVAFYSLAVVLLVQILWVVAKQVSPQLKPLAEPATIILVFLAFAAVFRLALLPALPIVSGQTARAVLYDLVTSLLFYLLLLSLNVSLIMMVARRLLWEMQAEERKFNRVFDLAPNAMLVVDMKTAKVIDANQGFCRLFGIKISDIIGKKVSDLPIWTKPFEVMEILHRISLADVVVTRDIECKKLDGARINVIYSASPMRMYYKEYMIVSMEEITALSKVKKQLEEMATHDSLTGLPNRRLLYDHFTKAAARASRNDTRVAFMLFDIDDFKNINDVLGHSTGDELLMQVATRLVQVSRQQDTIGRLGGDEFAVLLVDVKDQADITTVINRLRDALKPPLDIRGHKIHITISAGCAIFPDHGKTLEELMQKADYAMYYVKKHGKNGFCFFEPSMQ
ncbi:diguanylate cyclase [Coprothermobacteraceae bacterium]|nr:diguanylate cyclase [Coprothermobacteraceae bacterium]